MKRIIILFFLCYTIPLIAQHTDPIQEAMANYDYETALSLIAQKKSTPPLLLQKGKALRGLGLTTEALATYQEIIRNDTTNTRAFIEAAECCRTLANYNQALYLQPIITQYFIDNKSEIWLLFLIAHSKR